jgi:hypothetical protein
MKIEYMGITRALALAGATNFDFVDEEALWKGSEVHKMIELYDLRRLHEPLVPDELRGYLHAHKKFLAETGFIVQEVEKKVQSKDHRLRGRIDRAGLLKGKKTIVDFKTGVIGEAVGLQLALGGFLLNPDLWWHRSAVRLKADGSYSMKNFPLIEWGSDLADALACVRVAQWKTKQGLV